MGTTNDMDRCLRAIDEFRREVAETAPDDLDIGALERKLREKLNDVGCAVMREVLERADTKAPRVSINGKDWGNRRESKGTSPFKVTILHRPLQEDEPSTRGACPCASCVAVRASSAHAECA